MGHKQAEDKMRLAQFALDHSPDSSIWINGRGEIVYVNIETTKSLGYSYDELLSMKIWDIDPDYHYEKYIESWNETKRLGARKIESIHVRKDGSIYPVEVSIIYLKFEDKEYLVTFDRDITQRKQAEEALSDAKARAEMYLDLMSHDIRNYNQIALGYLELAMDVLDLDEGGRELISKPIDAVNSSSRLINNVLKLQRATGGKALKNQLIDLCDILEKIKANNSNVPGRQITINYRPAPMCNIMANDLIYDVFSNLIGNALKHTSPDKPLTIDISVKGETIGGRTYLKISIEDNGPGIPDALKGKLFTRLEQGRTKASGRGLGLYLVRTLVEDFGGKVWVEDRVTGDYRQGVRFVVALPAVTSVELLH
jgi:PAS domain S-box-containing protein